MNDVTAALTAVRTRIQEAERTYGRPAGSVALLAVSKTHPKEAVAEVFAAGQRAFGENHLQDAMTKITALADTPIEWHFIGPVQSNKTRAIAEHFAWVHTLERERIARRLDEQRPPGAPPLNVCIEVNVSGEASKSGLAPEEVARFAGALRAYSRLKLRGLMTIPAPAEGLAAQRRALRPLARLQNELLESGFDVDTLSMGMTDDLEAAIAEGATLVRVGTAIFGPRHS